MIPEAVFSTWAPADSIWSNWVKPVAFAHIPPSWQAFALEPVVPAAIPEFPISNSALIVDLPEDSSIPVALALANRGVRPVPLFNGALRLPAPPASEVSNVALEYRVTINVWPIVRSLAAAAPQIGKLVLPADAPPAFLLDSRRRMGDRAPSDGTFDNRWISFPTDFPSANFLHAHDIHRAILITQFPGNPAADLAHTLLRWQQENIQIEQLVLMTDTVPAPITIRKPNRFRSALYQVAAIIGLIRNPLGGFGGVLSESSSG